MSKYVIFDCRSAPKPTLIVVDAQENVGGMQPRNKYKRAAFVAFAALMFVAVITKISSDVAGRPGGDFE